MALTPKEAVEKKLNELEPLIDGFLCKGGGSAVAIREFSAEEVRENYFIHGRDVISPLKNNELLVYEVIKKYGDAWDVEYVPPRVLNNGELIFTPKKSD